MKRAAYLVVGAGPSGMGMASELATHADVTIIDRIPVTGGTAGWSKRSVRQLTAALREAGVQLRLGQTALHWDGSELRVASPGKIGRLPGHHLFFAGGLRPATLADLRIDGDRPAGVLPATVAEHLLHAGTKLWDRVAILGDGPWARPVAEMCRSLGTTVLTVSAGREQDQDSERTARYGIVGRDRVTALRRYSDSGIEDILCDAVVLASDPRPNRNIEGALQADATRVTFHQPTAPLRFEERVEAARTAARQWITSGDSV